MYVGVAEEGGEAREHLREVCRHVPHRGRHGGHAGAAPAAGEVTERGDVALHYLKHLS
jgi:hypothetical protein